MVDLAFTPAMSRRQLLRYSMAAAVGGSLAALLGETGSAQAATNRLGSISMVGDSLTVGTRPYQASDLVSAGWSSAAIDAHGSRGIRTKVAGDRNTGLSAVASLRSRFGDSSAWVVALGTNDSGIYARSRYAALIREMCDCIGESHRIMWVNIYMPRSSSRQRAWNDALSEVAAERPTSLTVYDWASLAAQHRTWLAGDGIHYTGTGYRYRSTAVADASVILEVPVGDSADARHVNPRR